jgi:hypothetical protein
MPPHACTLFPTPLAAHAFVVVGGRAAPQPHFPCYSPRPRAPKLSCTPVRYPMSVPPSLLLGGRAACHTPSPAACLPVSPFACLHVWCFFPLQVAGEGPRVTSTPPRATATATPAAPTPAPRRQRQPPQRPKPRQCPPLTRPPSRPCQVVVVVVGPQGRPRDPPWPPLQVLLSPALLEQVGENCCRALCAHGVGGGRGVFFGGGGRNVLCSGVCVFGGCLYAIGASLRVCLCRCAPVQICVYCVLQLTAAGVSLSPAPPPFTPPIPHIP